MFYWGRLPGLSKALRTPVMTPRLTRAPPHPRASPSHQPFQCCSPARHHALLPPTCCSQLPRPPTSRFVPPLPRRCRRLQQRQASLHGSACLSQAPSPVQQRRLPSMLRRQRPETSVLQPLGQRWDLPGKSSALESGSWLGQRPDAWPLRYPAACPGRRARPSQGLRAPPVPLQRLPPGPPLHWLSLQGPMRSVPLPHTAQMLRMQ